MRKKLWLRRAAVFLLLLLLADAGLSRFLRSGRAHAYLNARLEAAFGRPVEVRRFDFSLVDGLRLRADLITVAEDPPFGYEYFLRAERLTASLRWRSLARGRFEFGTLSFTRPSLNLVRAADDHWNVESWLPPPRPAREVASGAAGASTFTRLYRIEVDGGRINFKRGVNKHPFALGDVKGRLEQEVPGRWRMDLEARPVRAAAVLQETGTIRVRGRIAGTSARLQPAELFLTWREASLADVLRLASGNDFGVRGRLAVELSARSEVPTVRRAPRGEEEVPISSATEGARWFLSGTARLENAHRWDLPQRPGSPALNLSVEAQWRPSQARMEFSQCVVEAPRSNVIAFGKIQWAPAFDSQFHILSSGIGLADLLAWYRAFRPGVAQDLTIEGDARMDFDLSGWPPRLERGWLTSDGAGIRFAGLLGPIRVGRIVARMRPDRPARVELEPTTLLLGARSPGAAKEVTPQDNPLRIGGAIQFGGSFSRPSSEGARFEVNLAGQTDRAQDLLAAAQAFGYARNHGWSVEGPAGLSLRWQGSLFPFRASAIGKMDLRGLLLRTSFLNQPVNLAHARVEWRAKEQRVLLFGAQGLGARWRGSLWKRLPRSGDAAEPWEFDLAADRLDAVELDRWLGPRARPGLLQRIVPFIAAGRTPSEPDAVLEALRSRGRLSVDEFDLAPLHLRRLHARTEIQGRNLKIPEWQAEISGGSARGSLEAEFSAGPFYHLRAQFERVNLALLTGATPTLKGRFAGMASGQLSLAARGVGRESLVRSLEGHGALHVRGAVLHGLDLNATYAAGTLRPGTSQFAAVDARFSLAAGRVGVEKLRLANHQAGFEAKGHVSFSRALDLQLLPLARPRGEQTREGPGSALRITGLLEAPEVSRLEAEGGKPVKK